MTKNREFEPTSDFDLDVNRAERTLQARSDVSYQPALTRNNDKLQRGIGY